MKNTLKFEIEELTKLYYELIEKEEKNIASKEEIEQIEKYSKQILELIKQQYLELEFDFILECLVDLGHSPCLLYDDDGHWAITSDGVCTAVYDGPKDWDGVFQVSKDEWFNTPRKALTDYLNNV